MQSVLDLIELIKNNDLLNFGNYYITKFSAEDNVEENEIFLEPNYQPLTENGVDKLSSRILADTNHDELNLFFNGDQYNIYQSSYRLQLLKAIIQQASDHNIRLFINEKIKMLNFLVKYLFNVLNSSGVDCSTNPIINISISRNSEGLIQNLMATPYWYNNSYASSFSDLYSTFQLYYLIAASSNNPILEDSCTASSTLISKRFCNSNLLKLLKQDGQKFKKCLKAMKVKDEIIIEILEYISGLIEISQVYAHNNNKNVEFIGAVHIPRAGHFFKVKESVLIDYLYNKYYWENNTKKLNEAKNINEEIESFIRIIYHALVTYIFTTFNKWSANETDKETHRIINFYSIPNCETFKNDKCYPFDDFQRYTNYENFQHVLAENIKLKLNEYLNFATCNSKEIKLKPSDLRSTCFEELTKVWEILSDWALSKNKKQFIKALSKDTKNLLIFDLNKDEVEINLGQMQNKVKFDIKKINVYKNVEKSKGFKNFYGACNSKISYYFRKIPNYMGHNSHEAVKEEFNLTDVYQDNNIFIYMCSNLSSKLGERIIQLNLDYVVINEINFDIIKINSFVDKYKLLFLHQKSSVKGLKAVAKAIFRLNLSETWFCEKFVHISKNDLLFLDNRIQFYFNSILKLQNYSRIIIAKIRLRKLKELAKTYQVLKMEADVKFSDLFSQFEEEYNKINFIDINTLDYSIFKCNIPQLEVITKADQSRWLQVLIMSKRDVLYQSEFFNSSACVYHLTNDDFKLSSCCNLNSFLSNEMKMTIKDFIIKFNHDSNFDVIMECKAAKQFYLWNYTQKDDQMFKAGYIYPNKKYRIYSHECIIQKMAYFILNEYPYNFEDFMMDCSRAVIIEPDKVNTTSLTKAPLWMIIVNLFPSINISSMEMFSFVDKMIRKFDKEQCSKFIKTGPLLLTNDDWILEDLGTQLLWNSLQMDDEKMTSKQFNSLSMFNRPSVMSINESKWSKENFENKRIRFD